MLVVILTIIIIVKRRSRTFSAVTVRASYTEHKTSSSRHVDKTQIPESSSAARLLNRYYSYPALNHQYSSIAGTKSSGEEDDDDLADGFSELEEVSAADEVQEKNLEDEKDDVIVSESELSEDEGDDVNVPEKTPQPKRAFSVLFKVIMDSPSAPVQKTLDKWAENGESISRSDVSVALIEFRKRRMFERALQVFESFCFFDTLCFAFWK